MSTKKKDPTASKIALLNQNSFITASQVIPRG